MSDNTHSRIGRREFYCATLRKKRKLRSQKRLYQKKKWNSEPKTNNSSTTTRSNVKRSLFSDLETQLVIPWSWEVFHAAIFLESLDNSWCPKPAKSRKGMHSTVQSLAQKKVFRLWDGSNLELTGKSLVYFLTFPWDRKGSNGVPRKAWRQRLSHFHV